MQIKHSITTATLSLVEQFEGLSLVSYKDLAGNSTIGYGHLIKPGEHFNEPISKQEAIDLLSADLAAAARTINKAVEVPLSQNQFDALVSLVFNIGSKPFIHSTLLKLLNAGNYAAAAGQFLRWDKALVHGHLLVVSGLARRRQIEHELFLTPDSH